MQTDAAREIVDLIEDLRTISRQGTVGYSVVANHWQIDENSTEFLELLGIVSSRFNEFKKFVETVNDPYVTQRVRSRVLSSVVTASSAFNPARISGPWQHIIDQNLSEEVVGNIELFCSIAAKYRPLRKLTDEERADLLKKIEAQIDDLKASDGPEWMIVILQEGLLRIYNTLFYIRVFGHDKAIDDISHVFQRFSALYVTTKDSPDSKEKSASQKVYAGINIAMLAANLFCVTDQGLTAFERYKGWLIAPVAQAQIEGPKEQKFIQHQPKDDEKV